jgi:hypothetical protein
MLGESTDLRAGKGEKMEKCGAPGEGLAHRFQQREVLGARQNPSARRRILIDQNLEIGWQFWATLHFVNDGVARKLAEETARILVSEPTDVWRL